MRYLIFFIYFCIFRHSTGLVRDLLSAIVVISPDSMTVERSVSTYNILYSKLRTTTNQKTLNDRMIIAWNGVPTASYDPRPAVVSFFNKKERRNARPCLDHVFPLNDRMIIAWNGVPTASYDPRPAVVSFFNKKERRNARPCLGHVFPIHKDGDHEVASNNRPISLLAAFSKVCDKVVLNQFTAHLIKRKSLSNHQSGNRKKPFN